MNCPGCTKEIVADKLFCTWCDVFVPNPSAGTKAGIGRRWFASVIDPIVGLIVFLFIVATAGGVGAGISGGIGLGIFAIVGAIIAFIVFNLKFLAKGMTIGKWMLGEQVVDKRRGGNPGILRMLLREVFGKFISGLFFGLGYFWAIFDKDNQAWHDKIAGTVVVHKEKKPA